MMKQFKLIIDERGKEILNDRIALEEAMRQKGCDERDIHTVMLILASCPTVAKRLIAQEPTKRDVRFMINSCCALTGLHGKAARRGIGMLMYGCGYASGFAPRLTVFRLHSGNPELLPEHCQEDQAVSELIERIAANSNDAAALSDLSALAQAGNPRAAYYFGCLEISREDSEAGQLAMERFLEASRGGFGPADGALADLLMRTDRKNIARAAQCFNNPASLYGKEGRRWKALSKSLLQYRTENKKRLGLAAIWQGATLAASGVLLGLTCGFGVLGILCLVGQSLALLWTILCWIIKPYTTSRTAYYALMLSWLLLAFCVL